MRKRLAVSGFERCKKNFGYAQFHARMKISAAVKMVRWYLGNQIIFLSCSHFVGCDDAMRRTINAG
jgi:hypothetical protein